MKSSRVRVIVVALVVASITVLILDLRGGDGPLSGVRTVAASIVGAVEKGAATAFSPVTGLANWWSTVRDQSNQIQALTDENLKLSTQVREQANDAGRVAALDGLLKVAGVGGYTIVPAEVIAVNPVQDFSWTVTIDAGRNDGIEQDMSVINGQGLVGRVLKTTATTATVVLIVDSSSAVGARIAGSQEIGIIAGTGDQYSLEYQLLDPRADVRTGDALVTFGSKGGRPFAPGIPIGEVRQVQGTAGQLTRMAVVRPYVDISRLSIVGVVTRPPRTDPRDSVLPRTSAQNSPAPIPLADGSTPAPLTLGGSASPSPTGAELLPSSPASPAAGALTSPSAG